MSVENIDKLAQDVLFLSRNTLALNLRFMDKPISMLDLQKAPKLNGVAVDGTCIYYDPIVVLRNFSEEQARIPRQYLHMILHCVYQHFWVSSTVNKILWDLSCDIAVEYTIFDMAIPALEIKSAEIQQKAFQYFKKKVKYMTADMLYKYLLNAPLSEKQVYTFAEIFSADIHNIWYQSKREKPKVSQNTEAEGNSKYSQDGQEGNLLDTDELQQPYTEANGNSECSQDCQEDDLPDTKEPQQPYNGQDKDEEENEHNESKSELGQTGDTNSQCEWAAAARQMKVDLETFSRNHGKQTGALTQNLMAVTRERYNYTEFLKKFAVLGERMKLNDDEFDCIFYTYGMNLYGNMPLIEPLEYKDVKQIKEFVIAIDTSGSTSGILVQTFVKKTYSILKQEESFFKKFNLHIIQCDERIQEDIKITKQSEFDAYIANMQILGHGGTDFRPTFAYVDRLIADGEFSNLKGLIYFTDGEGTFPLRQPNYHTAFVFVDEGYINPSVPPWAIKIVLQPDDIRRTM